MLLMKKRAVVKELIYFLHGKMAPFDLFFIQYVFKNRTFGTGLLPPKCISDIFRHIKLFDKWLSTSFLTIPRSTVFGSNY